MFKSVKEVIEYREMIKMMIHRDLRGRYKASVLGFTWTFINPFLQLLIYSFVFSIILRSNIEKYYLFLFVALIPWLGMSGSVMTSSTCIVSHPSLITKIYFPRRVLPLAAVATNIINMLFCMIVVLVVCLLGIGLEFRYLWYLIPAVFVEFILAFGIGLIVSSLTVYFRDLEHILSIFVLMWQFVTPIMYPLDMVPERFRTVFMLNPMTPVVTIFRDVLYYKRAPELNSILAAFAIGTVFVVLGWALFGKLEKRFAEEL